LLTYAIGWLSWKFFEHPLLQRGHNFKYAPATAPAPQPAASTALVSD